MKSLSQILPDGKLILGLLAGLVFGVLMGYLSGNNSIKTIWIVFLTISGFVVLMSLGRWYWILLPAAYSFDLPAIPFAGRAVQFTELATLGCSLLYFARTALKAEKFNPFQPIYLPIMAYVIWAILIYQKNPVGMAIFGSEMAGAREYVTLGLGFIAFFIVAQQRIGPKEAAWIIAIWIVGAVVGAAWTIGSFLFRFGSTLTGNEFYTWHQSLSFPAYVIALWIFCRYKPAEIFSLKNLKLPSLLVLCFVMVMYSGKRAVGATFFLAPVLASFFRKDWKSFILGSLMVALLIVIMVVGHGSWFHLPLQAQRVLMNLPGDWDPDIARQVETSTDSFREFMREKAWEKIRKNPIVGDGLGIHIQDVLASLDVVGGSTDQKTLLAEGSSWHSTWLGIWADFGFPPMVFFAVLCIQFFWVAHYVFRNTSHGEHMHTLALMLLIFFTGTLLRSYTSGTAVTVATYIWWRFAIVVGMFRYLKSSVKEHAFANLPARSGGAQSYNSASVDKPILRLGRKTQ